MHRILFLLIGLTVLPPTARAAHLTAADLRQITPVSSHYVQRILDRADTAILLAAAEPSLNVPTFGLTELSWVNEIASTILSMVDTQLRIEEQQRGLREFTACLHLDLMLIEAKIEEVQTALHTAAQNRQVGAIIRLTSLARFLNDRYRELIHGWNNPLWEDKGWGRQYSFDPPPQQQVWCCVGGIPGNACEQQTENDCFANGVAFQTPRACQDYGCILPPAQDPQAGKVCPFHSDYLPPVTAGYGCDTSVLDAYMQSGSVIPHLPTQWEYRTGSGLLAARSAFIDDLQELPTIIRRMGQLSGRPVGDLSAFGSAMTAPHGVVIGCPATGTGDVLLVPQVFGSGASLLAPRGPFSLDRDEPLIQYRFYRLIRDWMVLRPYAKDLRLPTEFPPGLERTNATATEQGRSFFQQLSRSLLRFMIQGWSRKQTEVEGRPIAKGQDAPLRIQPVIYPDLRVSVAALSRLSGSQQGPRGFSLGLAYYLRRSCVYRPCNQRLEQIMQILFEDACFPYVSGAYQNESEPQYLKCKADANIVVSP